MPRLTRNDMQVFRKVVSLERFTKGHGNRCNDRGGDGYFRGLFLRSFQAHNLKKYENQALFEGEKSWTGPK